MIAFRRLINFLSVCMQFFKRQKRLRTAIALLFLTLLIFCVSQLPSLTRANTVESFPTTHPSIELAQNHPQHAIKDGHDHPDATFTLRTDIGQGKLIFVGEGGTINGQINPDLVVKTGDMVQIRLIDGETDGAEHDIVLPDLKVQSGRVKN